MSSNGGSHHDGNHNIPAVIIDGTGQLKGSRYLRFPSPAVHNSFGTDLGKTENAYATHKRPVRFYCERRWRFDGSLRRRKQSRGPLP